MSHSQLGDTLRVQITAAQLAAIGNNDNNFDGVRNPGPAQESFDLSYTQTAMNCGAANAIESELRAYYGCGSICSDVSILGSLGVNLSVPPILSATYNMPASSCYDYSTIHTGTLTITNSGGLARDANIYFGDVWGLPTQYNYGLGATEMDTASVMVSINGGPSFHPTLIDVKFNGANPYNFNGTSSCGTELKPCGAYINVPSLANGQTIVITYNFKKCHVTQTQCPSGDLKNMDNRINYSVYQLRYKNACLDANYGDAPNSYNYPSMPGYGKSLPYEFVQLSLIPEFPTDLVDNQVGNFTTTISSGYIEEYLFTNNGYLQVTQSLPPGFSLASVPNNIEFVDGDGTVWPATIANANPLQLQFAFPRPAGFSTSGATLNLKIQFNCAAYQAGPNSTPTVNQSWGVLTDPSCSSLMNLLCFNHTINLHCPSPCPEGIGNTLFTMKRISTGAPDNNNDGIADASGSIDPAKVRLDRAMVGDTIELSYHGVVYDAGTPFTSAYAHSLFPTVSHWSVLPNSEAYLYRGGSLFASVTNLTTLINAVDSLKTDISGLGTMINLDSIVVKVRMRLDANIGGNIEPVIPDNIMYATRPANPSTWLYCDHWNGRVSKVGYYHTYYYGNSPNLTDCNSNYISINDYLSVGPCCDNYGNRSFLFPYEVKQYSYLDSVKFILPVGLTLDRVDIDFSRPGGNNTANFSSYTHTETNVPVTQSGGFYHVNAKQYYAEFGGNANNPIADDGWNTQVRVYVKATCTTPALTNLYLQSIEDFKSINPFIPDAHYELNYPTVTNYPRYAVANGSQLTMVAGASASKNIAGDTVKWTNLTIANQSTVASNINTWVYIQQPTATTTIVSVTDNLGNPIPQNNGFYELGAMATSQQRQLNIIATTTSCNRDSVKVYYGYDCAGYPTSFSPALCNFNPITLVSRPLSAKIDGFVTTLANTPLDPSNPGAGNYGSNTVNMCSPIPVEMILNSALQGNIYDVNARVQLPTGVSYVPGSAYIEYPIGTTPRLIDIAHEAVLASVGPGGILNFKLDSIDATNFNTASDKGLYGTAHLPSTERQVKIRYQVQVDCNYPGTGRLRMNMLAKRACGTNAVNNNSAKTSSRYTLTAPPSVYQNTIVNLTPSLNSCSDIQQASTTITKIGNNMIGVEDSIRLEVPTGITVSNIVCTGCPSGTIVPVINSDNGVDIYTWPYPAFSGPDYGNGILQTYTYNLSALPTGPCAANLELTVSVIEKAGFTCLGVPCPNNLPVEGGTATSNFNYNKPNFSISPISALTYSTLPPYTYQVNAVINNTSGISATGFKVLYAIDVDGDSLYNAAIDILVDTITYNSVIPAAGNLPVNLEVTTLVNPAGADFMAVILPLDQDSVNGSCACGEAYGYASITQGLTASLGDKVWNDLNNDGVQDAGEVGVAGITVTLYDANNVVVGTTVTDAYGNYLFDDLVPGDYSVGFTLPQNYEFSPSTGTSEGDATNSDVNPTTGKTTSVTLSAGENQLNIDAGIHFTQPTTASVGNYVWNDTDGDGIQDANEVGISGVTVTLYDNSGNPVATVITDANGFYEFTNVVPGTYTVGFTPPVGYVTSPNNGGVNDPSNSDANPLTGQTAAFVVNAGDRITYVDAGFTPQNAANASLGDKVWNDLNQDGIQDAGEPGVAGVTVTLYGSDGVTVIGTTTTDAFGNYVFNNLTPGTYVVGFSTPSGYTLTTPGAGSDSTLNSDAIIATGKTAPIVLAAGQNNMTIDAGIYNTNPANTNSIGDKVWNDLDQDGIQDANEPGISGVTVTLYDNIGNVVAITSTDANGNYLFPNLPNGTYTVGFSNLPNGFIFTQTGQGTSSTDSDPNPSTGITSPITLSGNTNVTDVDAGLVQGNTRIGTATLGDRVWYDLDGDGIQDAGESGVAGVTVTLYAADGTTVLATTTTDALGNYIFTGLDAGSYIVGFSNLPAGFTVSPENADAQGINGEDNSDVNAGTLRTPTIVLTTGEDKMSVDMGIVPPVGTASLGNFVWYDLDGDGIQDANEPGMQGITVTLYDGAGNIVATTTTDANGEYQFVGLAPGTYSVGFTNLPNGFSFAPENADATGINGATNSDANPTTGRTGTVTLISGENNTNLDAGIITTTKASLGDYVWNDINGNGIQDPNEPGVAGVLVTLYDNLGNPISSTITGPNGEYLFANLDPGTYQVGFSNLPSGMVFTTQEVDPNSPTGSNVNPTTGLSAPVTLTAGGFNPTIDAGLTTPPTAGLGNYVWNDVDQDGIQDAGEPGVSGVLVTLYASDGTTVLGTAITDGNGAYSFTNLPSGTYVVGFSNLPLGYTRTQVVGSLNDGNNSDMNMGGQTNPITLTNGEYNPNIDAGIYFGVPLPARELKAIVAIIKESNVCEVSWFTREEQNTSRFEIERSANGMDFEQVGTTAASGSTQGLTNYSYNDDIAVVNQLSIIYYRIKLIDIDGKFTYSNVISAVRGSSNDALMIYPNPFENALNIDYVAESDDVLELTLTDLSGRVVSRMQKTITKGANKITWNNLGSLSSGQYYIRVSSLENGNSYLRKLNK
jgi:protocatechuate 3,4-dioxygenase beta subunit